MTARSRTLIAALLVMAGVETTIGQQNRAPAEKLLAAAQHQATVDGDLLGAIKQYSAIADTFRNDPRVASNALLRMAEAYEKLGGVEATRVYQRILREYPNEQHPASIARARVGQRAAEGDVAARTPTTSYRSVWSGQEVAPEGSISSDGRYVSFPAWATGDLGIHDLATGKSRLVTNVGDYRRGFAQGSSFSRDGTQLAYTWFRDDPDHKHYELRVITVTQQGFATPRTLLDDDEIAYIVPRDWTPDGKWISLQIHRKDAAAQLGLVSTRDGSLRVLKTTGWRGATGLFISPDGRHLAYDLPSAEPFGPRDVFAMDIEHAKETRVVAHPKSDRVMGWTPDGKRLLFASDRSGRFALWSVRIADGAASGAEELLYSQEVSPSSLGVAAGKLFVFAETGIRDVQTAPIDFSTGQLVRAPTSAVTTVGVNSSPAWSPDGQRLAYVSSRYFPEGAQNVPIVRSLTPGSAARELTHGMGYLNGPYWTPDGRALIVGSRDQNGRRGVHRIDTETGEVTLLAPNIGDCVQTTPISPDGHKVYYFSGGCDGAPYVEFDLRSGTERTVFRGVGPRRFDLSRDGQLLTGVTNDSTLVIVDVASGQQRVLYRPPSGTTLRWATVAWVPDQSGVIVVANEKSTSRAVFVPVNGAAPRMLALPPGADQIRVHPDGKQIAFSVGQSSVELWALENFLPAKGVTP